MLTAGSAYSQPVEQDDQRRDDRPDRAEGVGDHVAHRGGDVEARVRVRVEDPRGDEVDDQPERGDHQHQPALDLGRVAEAAPGLDEDPDRDRDERDAVEERGEDLRPPVAERLRRAAGPGREPRREQRDPQRENVGEHVRGVGEQRQAAGDQAADDLGDEERRGEDEDGLQCAGGPGACVIVAVGVAQARAASSVRIVFGSMKRTSSSTARSSETSPAPRSRKNSTSSETSSSGALAPEVIPTVSTPSSQALVDLTRVVDQIRGGAVLAGHLDEPVGVRRVGRAHDEHELALAGQLLDRDLAIGGRVTNVIRLRRGDVREALAQPGDDLVGLVDRERRLRDQGDVVGVGQFERVDVGDGLDQDDVVGRLARGALDLLVALVADQDDRVAVLGELARLDVDLGHQRTGRVDRPQVARGRVRVDAGSDAVSREDDQRALGHLGLLLDEDRTALGELLDHVLVVDDLLAHVDRRPVHVERLLDGLHGAVDAGAVAARRGEDDPLRSGDIGGGTAKGSRRGSPSARVAASRRSGTGLAVRERDTPRCNCDHGAARIDRECQSPAQRSAAIADQSQRRFADGVEALGADLVDRVLRRVPVGAGRRPGAVVEVDQVDRGDAGFDERDVVVGDREGGARRTARASPRGVREQAVELGARVLTPIGMLRSQSPTMSKRTIAAIESSGAEP